MRTTARPDARAFGAPAEISRASCTDTAERLTPRANAVHELQALAAEKLAGEARPRVDAAARLSPRQSVALVSLTSFLLWAALGAALA